MVMDRDTFLLLLSLPLLPLLRLLLFLELHCFYHQWKERWREDGGMSECSKCGTSLHAAFVPNTGRMDRSRIGIGDGEQQTTLDVGSCCLPLSFPYFVT